MNIKWWKENWMNAVMWAFAMGVMWATFNARMTANEKRTDSIESANVEQMKYRVETNTNDITVLKADQRAAATTISQMSSKLDVMATKIDYLVDRQRRDEQVRP